MSGIADEKAKWPRTSDEKWRGSRIGSGGGQRAGRSGAYISADTQPSTNAFSLDRA